MKEQFTALLSKYESALSDFKRKRRYAYISDENYINYNSHIERLMSMIDIIKSKLVTIESHENDARMRNLIDEYDAIADTNDDLIDSIRRELENSDKSDWYAKNFDNWANCHLDKIAMNIQSSIVCIIRNVDSPCSTISKPRGKRRRFRL